MDTETLSFIFSQGPYFALLCIVGYGFYKFQERTYNDHNIQMIKLQETFRESLNLITNTFGVRLDKIEDTLEKIK